MTCCKVEELVAALYVAEGTETDSTSGSKYHGVDGYIFFMNLCICSKWEMKVLFVINRRSRDNSTRTNVGDMLLIEGKN